MNDAQLAAAVLGIMMSILFGAFMIERAIRSYITYQENKNTELRSRLDLRKTIDLGGRPEPDEPGIDGQTFTFKGDKKKTMRE